MKRQRKLSPKITSMLVRATKNHLGSYYKNIEELAKTNPDDVDLKQLNCYLDDMRLFNGVSHSFDYNHAKKEYTVYIFIGELPMTFTISAYKLKKHFSVK